ncbi:MAG: hypothetical protein E4H16_04980 [Candidatus Atribacteria bacterium]|nr:MAG: hypothetical protein E4H16_04980 [Candidatus Atribacteria bacterium]
MKPFFTSLIRQGVKFRWEKKTSIKPPAKAKAQAKRRRKSLIEKKIIHEKPAEKPLSVRERKAVKNLAAGMTKKDALVSAGYSESVANTKAATVFVKPRVLRALKDLMEDMELSDEVLLQVMKKGLGATRVISAMVIASSGDGMKDAGSMTKDFIEVPDYRERRESATTLLKLKGHGDKNKEDELPYEPYEAFRKRMGLDKISIKEAIERILDKVADRVAKEKLEAAKG